MCEGSCGYTAGRDKRVDSSPKDSGQLWGPPRLLFNEYRGLLPKGKVARSWRLPLTSTYYQGYKCMEQYFISHMCPHSVHQHKLTFTINKMYQPSWTTTSYTQTSQMCVMLKQIRNFTVMQKLFFDMFWHLLYHFQPKHPFSFWATSLHKKPASTRTAHDIQCALGHDNTRKQIIWLEIWRTHNTFGEKERTWNNKRYF